jgi:hypothetical protein
MLATPFQVKGKIYDRHVFPPSSNMQKTHPGRKVDESANARPVMLQHGVSERVFSKTV